jgi:hypothetical protein
MAHILGKMHRQAGLDYGRNTSVFVVSPAMHTYTINGKKKERFPMRDLSRFRRFITAQAMRQAINSCGDWDEHGAIADALRLFDVADHVYEQAEDFEERLSLKDEIAEQEVYTFTQAEGTRLIEEGVDILGLQAALKLLVRDYGAEPILHRLAVLAEEKATVTSQ